MQVSFLCFCLVAHGDYLPPPEDYTAMRPHVSTPAKWNYLHSDPALPYTTLKFKPSDNEVLITYILICHDSLIQGIKCTKGRHKNLTEIPYLYNVKIDGERARSWLSVKIEIFYEKCVKAIE